MLGKQSRKDLFDLLTSLQLVVSIENDCLNQGLGLLSARFPNGFDRQAHFFNAGGRQAKCKNEYATN